MKFLSRSLRSIRNDWEKMPSTVPTLCVVWICSLAIGLPSSALAQSFDITGVWRDENAQQDDKDTPMKLTLQERPSFNDNLHGTYRSRPYLLITLQDRNKPNGPYFMYSDAGDLRAELQPVGSDGTDWNIIDRRTQRTIGLLQTDAQTCQGFSPCFVLSSGTADLSVPTSYDGLPVRYQPVGRYDPQQDLKTDDGKKETFGDMFAPLSANFSYVYKCWHMARMDPVDYQNPGCSKNVFDDKMPAANSYGYEKVGFLNWHDAAVPYAWTYVSRAFQKGEERAHTWENGQDIVQADSLKVGLKASADVFGVSASTHVSVGISRKVEDMYSSKYSYSKSEYLNTQFAFVLNKYYVSLAPEMKQRIQHIRTLPEESRTLEYRRFVNDFGTHYASAITFGSKGERQLRMSQTQVMKMNDSKTDVSVGMTAGYAGNTVGVDVDTSNQNMNKINQNSNTEDRNFFCYSGGTCNDGIPTSDDALPVQLDLRPISELLGPPFYTDDETLTTLRDGINKEVAAQAFVKRNGLQLPSAVFATVTGFRRYNITGFASSLQSLNTDSQFCGAGHDCKDGLATLTSVSDDGTSTILEIPANVAQPPQWRIPAVLDDKTFAPRVKVHGNYNWTGRCLNGAGTWSFGRTVSSEVSLPSLTPLPQNSQGMSFVTSPSCVTTGNPLGVVTVLGLDSIIKVETAESLLGSP